LSNELIKVFNKFIYENHSNDFKEEFHYSYPEMAKWWVEIITLIIKTGTRPDGTKATECDIKKAKETIKRIEFEIDLFQQSGGQA